MCGAKPEEPAESKSTLQCPSDPAPAAKTVLVVANAVIGALRVPDAGQPTHGKNVEYASRIWPSEVTRVMETVTCSRVSLE